MPSVFHLLHKWQGSLILELNVNLQKAGEVDLVSNKIWTSSFFDKNPKHINRLFSKYHINEFYCYDMTWYDAYFTAVKHSPTSPELNFPTYTQQNPVSSPIVQRHTFSRIYLMFFSIPYIVVVTSNSQYWTWSTTSLSMIRYIHLSSVRRKSQLSQLASLERVLMNWWLGHKWSM